MTREEKIEWLNQLGETISPGQAAIVLGGDSYSYNIAAKEGKLTLRHIWRGRNLRISKDAVLEFIGGKTECRDTESSGQ